MKKYIKIYDVSCMEYTIIISEVSFDMNKHKEFFPDLKEKYVIIDDVKYKTLCNSVSPYYVNYKNIWYKIENYHYGHTNILCTNPLIQNRKEKLKKIFE